MRDKFFGANGSEYENALMEKAIAFFQKNAQGFNILNKVLKNEGDAEEVAQEILMTLVKKMPTGIMNIEAYLNRMARNRAISYIRDNKNQLGGLGFRDGLNMEPKKSLNKPERYFTSEAEIVSAIEEVLSSLGKKYPAEAALLREHYLKQRKSVKLVGVDLGGEIFDKDYQVRSKLMRAKKLFSDEFHNLKSQNPNMADLNSIKYFDDSE